MDKKDHFCYSSFLIIYYRTMNISPVTPSFSSLPLDPLFPHLEEIFDTEALNKPKKTFEEIFNEIPILKPYKQNNIEYENYFLEYVQPFFEDCCIWICSFTVAQQYVFSCRLSILIATTSEAIQDQLAVKIPQLSCIPYGLHEKLFNLNRSKQLKLVCYKYLLEETFAEIDKEEPSKWAAFANNYLISTLIDNKTYPIYFDLFFEKSKSLQSPEKLLIFLQNFTDIYKKRNCKKATGIGQVKALFLALKRKIGQEELIQEYYTQLFQTPLIDTYKEPKKIENISSKTKGKKIEFVFSIFQPAQFDFQLINSETSNSNGEKIQTLASPPLPDLREVNKPESAAPSTRKKTFEEIFQEIPHLNPLKMTKKDFENYFQEHIHPLFDECCNWICDFDLEKQYLLSYRLTLLIEKSSEEIHEHLAPKLLQLHRVPHGLMEQLFKLNSKSFMLISFHYLLEKACVDIDKNKPDKWADFVNDHLISVPHVGDIYSICLDLFFEKSNFCKVFDGQLPQFFQRLKDVYAQKTPKAFFEISQLIRFLVGLERLVVEQEEHLKELYFQLREIPHCLTSMDSLQIWEEEKSLKCLQKKNVPIAIPSRLNTPLNELIVIHHEFSTPSSNSAPGIIINSQTLTPQSAKEKPPCLIWEEDKSQSLKKNVSNDAVKRKQTLNAPPSSRSRTEIKEPSLKKTKKRFKWIQTFGDNPSWKQLNWCDLEEKTPSASEPPSTSQKINSQIDSTPFPPAAPEPTQSPQRIYPLQIRPANPIPQPPMPLQQFQGETLTSPRQLQTSQMDGSVKDLMISFFNFQNPWSSHNLCKKSFSNN